MRTYTLSLVELLKRMPPHHRHMAIERLLEYPEMIDIIIPYYRLRMARATTESLRAYESKAIKEIEQLYGTTA